MAKARPTTKKGGAAPSIHSRAARRETSPTINTDKTLLTLTPPPDTQPDRRASVIAARARQSLDSTGAGISKTKRKSGRKAVLSTTARKRRERGVERGAEIGDRTAQKVARSKGQAGAIKARKRVWDEVNGDAGRDLEKGITGKRRSNMFEGLEGGEDGIDEEQEEGVGEDEEVEMKMEDVAVAKEEVVEVDDDGTVEMKEAVQTTEITAPAVQKTVDARDVPLPAEEEDEVL